MLKPLEDMTTEELVEEYVTKSPDNWMPGWVEGTDFEKRKATARAKYAKQQHARVMESAERLASFIEMLRDWRVLDAEGLS